MEESSGSNIMMKPMTSNYSIWKPRMEDMLFFHDLEGVILGDSAKPSIMIDKKRKKLNRKTVSRIRQWLITEFLIMLLMRLMLMYCGMRCKRCMRGKLHRTKLFCSESL